MGRRTIDPAIRAEAIARRRAGEPTGIIAEDFGVDPTTIRKWEREADGDARPAPRSARSTSDDDDYASESGDTASGGSWVVAGVILVGVILAFVVAAAKSRLPEYTTIPEYPTTIPEYDGVNFRDDAQAYAPT